MSPAAALSTATPAWARVLQGKFGKPTWFIPNGFDETELPKQVAPPERFTLTYTGVFYRKKQDAASLLDAIARLKEERFIDPATFELRLVGRYLRTLQPDVEARGISDLISFHDTVSHSEALEQHAASTGLIFFLWTGQEGRGWLSAKVYEYMASGRPILAIGPRDVDAAELVRSMGAGEIAEDRAGVEDVLRRWIEEFRTKGALQQRVDRDRLKEYEWRQIGARLAAAFDAVVPGVDAGAATKDPP
jgi:glycosyltransferase involved in cell wall biosynthesis